jgi:hypothetical protein
MALFTPSQILGKVIIAADGADVGRVKEVHGELFKVDAPMARDYWLSTTAIDSVGEVVRLHLAEGAIPPYKVEVPDFDDEPADDEAGRDIAAE